MDANDLAQGRLCRFDSLPDHERARGLDANGVYRLGEERRRTVTYASTSSERSLVRSSLQVRRRLQGRARMCTVGIFRGTESATNLRDPLQPQAPMRKGTQMQLF